MPSEQEIQYHRTFLSLHMCRTIYNEDERHQYNPGGVPNRQGKIDSDPVFKYHVHSCPRYPQRAPGQPVDRQYYALLIRDNGSFEPLEIIPKRGQRFASVAMHWELENSVLCDSPGSFYPVVNSSMEVTGHSARVDDSQLLHPKGIDFNDISDYFKNEIPLFLWTYQVFDPSDNTFHGLYRSEQLTPGWEPFKGYRGGVSVLVLPNGKVIGARGYPYVSNNGHAVSVVSPLDFWTPGTRLAASAIRGLTNRVGGGVSAGFRLLSGPTKELAELSVARLAGKTLTGMAVSTGALPVKHLGRRTIIMGEDMAIFREAMEYSKPVSGFYDVIIHGDTKGFYVLVKTNPNGEQIWREVSVREVANAIRPNLGPGDKIRLLACETGHSGGGVAQKLADELNRTVWGPSTVLPVIPKGVKHPRFRPLDDGKFYEFVPNHRGDARLVGGGGKVTGNEVQGKIRSGVKK